MTKVLNIVVLGASRVGKTSLISQLTEKCLPSFYHPIPKSTSRISLGYNSKEYDCVITDTASHTTGTPLSPQFVIGTHAFILVYSVACRESFELVTAMQEKILDFGGGTTVPMVVVGNKNDLLTQREVSMGEGQILADSLCCPFLETTSYSYQTIYAALGSCISCIETPYRLHKTPSGSRTLLLATGYVRLRSILNSRASALRATVARGAASIRAVPDLSTPWNAFTKLCSLEFPTLQIPYTPSSWLPTLPTLQSDTPAKAISIDGSLPPVQVAQEGPAGPEPSATLRSSAPILQGIDDSQRTLIEATQWPDNQTSIRAKGSDLISDPDGFVRDLRMALDVSNGKLKLSQPKAKASLASVYSDLGDDFLLISEDRVATKALLALEGGHAQTVLDILQRILDSESTFLTRADRARILQLLLNLAKESGLYPECLQLTGISRKHTHAVTAGHFGEIWMGQFRRQSVCMKVVKVYQRSDINRLFKVFAREAILWSRLSHPNVLPLYGISRLDDDVGRICLISPWMENGCVGDYLIRYPHTNRYNLVQEVCQGLLYLHNQGIIHGDLKGVNILVTRSGRASLADFGLSSIAESEFMRWSSSRNSTCLGGTTRWQAPELIDPELDNPKPTKLSDIYSLGCVFYEIFTGNIPFHELQRESTVILHIQSGRKPSKRPLNSEAFLDWGLSETIWDLCIEECWSHTPMERPTIPYILTQLLPFCPQMEKAPGFEPNPDGWLMPVEVRGAARDEATGTQLGTKWMDATSQWLTWVASGVQAAAIP